MRTKVLLFLLLLLVLSFNASPKVEEERKLIIVATISPLGAIAREICGGKGEVFVLVPSGSDPHQYAPKPKEAELVMKCDLFISVGKEPFLGQLPEEKAGISLSWTDWVEAGAHLPEDNPHYIWMLPENAKVVAEVIAESLISLDPQNREYYSSNLISFKQKVDSLEAWISRVKETYEIEGKRVLLGGAHFEPIAEILGLEVVGVIMKGEQRLPSPSEVLEIKKRTVERETSLIIVLATQKEGDEGRIASQISKETGIPLIYVHGVSIDENDTYFEFMKYTVLQIIAGIQAGRSGGKRIYRPSTLPFWISIAILSMLSLFLTFLLMRCSRWSY